MRFLSQLVSVLFHPLLFATYLVAIIGVFFPAMLTVRSENLVLVLFLIFCFTFLLPAINMLLFRFFGNISSLRMETQQERILPFIFVSFVYALITFLFYFKLPFSDSFNKLMIIVTLLVVAATVTTFFFKVSVHSIAVCGMLGILIPCNRMVEGAELLWPTAWVMILCGVVMSARLYLQAHTPREILWGGVIGFCIGFFSIVLLY